MNLELVVKNLVRNSVKSVLVLETVVKVSLEEKQAMVKNSLANLNAISNAKTDVQTKDAVKDVISEEMMISAVASARTSNAMMISNVLTILSHVLLVHQPMMVDPNRHRVHATCMHAVAQKKRRIKKTIRINHPFHLI